MSGEPTTAIVIRTVEFSETSLIVTLLTKDFGRVSAIAKGARRPKGPFENSLDLLSVCRVVLIRKAGETLDLLTESKLRRRFRGGERSLDRVNAGFMVAELLRVLIDDDQPHEDIYDLTLSTMDRVDGTGDVALSLLYFELQLIRMLGHAPRIDACSDCGNSVSLQTSDSNHRWSFSFESGGLVCQGCLPRQRQVARLSGPVVQSLASMTSEETVSPTDVSREVFPTLRRLTTRYTQTITNRTLKMHALISQ